MPFIILGHFDVQESTYSRFSSDLAFLPSSNCQDRTIVRNAEYSLRFWEFSGWGLSEVHTAMQDGHRGFEVIHHVSVEEFHIQGSTIEKKYF